MKTEELKEQIVESRLQLALVMNNLYMKLDSEEYQEIESKVKQLHLYDLNGEFDLSLTETNKLIEELNKYEHE